jgi:hypothetical protein
MPESRPPIELQGISLAELQKLIDERRLPPVQKWNPERRGHSGMRIARDGTWYHEGRPISRPPMVRLFSTILRREPDGLNPLKIVEAAHGPSPRILVRHGLEAELTRPVYYELAELAIAEGREPPGLWSNGAFFPLDHGQ